MELDETKTALTTTDQMEEIIKGRKLMLAVIIGVIIMAFILPLTKTAIAYMSCCMTCFMRDAISGLFQQAIRFTPYGLSLLFMYKGNYWARMITLMIICIWIIVSSFFLFVSASINALILCALSIVAFKVLCSKPVIAYQKYKELQKKTCLKET